jgi:hypothetical protein
MIKVYIVSGKPLGIESRRSLRIIGCKPFTFTRVGSKYYHSESELITPRERTLTAKASYDAGGSEEIVMYLRSIYTQINKVSSSWQRQEVLE